MHTFTYKELIETVFNKTTDETTENDLFHWFKYNGVKRDCDIAKAIFGQDSYENTNLANNLMITNKDLYNLSCFINALYSYLTDKEKKHYLELISKPETEDTLMEILTIHEKVISKFAETSKYDNSLLLRNIIPSTIKSFTFESLKTDDYLKHKLANYDSPSRLAQFATLCSRSAELIQIYYTIGYEREYNDERATLDKLAEKEVPVYDHPISQGEWTFNLMLHINRKDKGYTINTSSCPFGSAIGEGIGRVMSLGIPAMSKCKLGDRYQNYSIDVVSEILKLLMGFKTQFSEFLFNTENLKELTNSGDKTSPIKLDVNLDLTTKPIDETYIEAVEYAINFYRKHKDDKLTLLNKLKLRSQTIHKLTHTILYKDEPVTLGCTTFNSENEEDNDYPTISLHKLVDDHKDKFIFKLQE